MSFPETRISLILPLAEWRDVQAWQEFSEIDPQAMTPAIRLQLQAYHQRESIFLPTIFLPALCW